MKEYIEEYFWELTPNLFGRYVENYRERQEQVFITSWEQVRWQTAALLAPYSKKGLKPTDLVVFPWESPQVSEMPQLPANWDKLSKAMDKQAKEEGIIN